MSLLSCFSKEVALRGGLVLEVHDIEVDFRDGGLHTRSRGALKKIFRRERDNERRSAQVRRVSRRV